VFPGFSSAPTTGRQKGALSPSLLWHTGKAPAPSVAVGVGLGTVPVVVLISPWLVLVKTVAVTAFGAAEMTVGVPSMVVATGVTVLGRPSSPTVTQRSVASGARGSRADGAGMAVTTPSRSSHAAVDACMVIKGLRVLSQGYIYVYVRLPKKSV